MWTVYSERLFQTQGTWTCCGWGKASPSMLKALSLQGLVVGADRGQECLRSPGEPSCNRLAFAKYQGLRKVAELQLRDCHFGARGHLAAG